MAGHSHSANIRHRKAAVDAKKGAAFSKHAKLIMTAARLGGGDPAMNPRLALAIDKARGDNMPKDKIERAIKKGTGELEGEQIEEIRYEAYGPGGVAILIDAITDNRNRSASDLRHLLEKHNGRLAESGSVAWMFNARALVEVKAEGVDEEKLFEVVTELGAEDLERTGEVFEVFGEATLLNELHTGLRDRGFHVERAELAMVPQTTVVLDRDAAERILAMFDALEAHDDVDTTHSNIEIPDEVLAELG
ncbi:MAG: YebC/PmpR family DNA-binding transcriptional regulator [Planctomycetota bacterium JB042]